MTVEELDRADVTSALMNFGLFWDRETRKSERNKLLRIMFERITVDGDQLQAVTRRPAF